MAPNASTDELRSNVLAYIYFTKYRGKWQCISC